MMIDETDILIAKVIDTTPKITLAELGNRVRLASNALWNRLKKLFRLGFIKHKGKIDWSMIGAS